MRQGDLVKKLQAYAPHIIDMLGARAVLGGPASQEAQNLLLPYVIPKADHKASTISDTVDIDISTTEKAKESLNRIAVAMGQQKIGLTEGTMLMDAVGKALDRISTADMAELAQRLEDLENTPAHGVLAGGAARRPFSRANGSTPVWGNMDKMPTEPHE